MVPDMTDQYNTELSPEEQPAYEAWAKLNPNMANKYDYDSQGFFKAGGATAPNGHGSDQFKKPNHPTFSDQSQYHGVDGTEGGTWQQVNGQYMFFPGKTNLETYGPDNLQDYFMKAEPGNSLQLPEDH